MVEQGYPFRPSLIVWVGDIGNDIYTQLDSSGLLEYLDESLRPCIGFIWYSSMTELVKFRLMSENEKPDQENRNITNGVQKNALLEAIEEMLKLVQLPESLQRIQNAGYTIAAIQIFVVGHSDSARVGEVLHILRELLHRQDANRLGAELSYILWCGPSEQQDTSSGKASDSAHIAIASYVDSNSKWNLQGREAPDFCYLYGGITNYSEEEYHYAIAEALFALIATGITSDPVFKEAMKAASDSNVCHYGTLNTCLIHFPFKLVRDYCTAEFSQKLVDIWLSDLEHIDKNASLPGTRQQGKVEEQKDSPLWRWIKDNTIHSGTVDRQIRASQTCWTKLLSKKDQQRLLAKVPFWLGLDILRAKDEDQQSPSFARLEDLTEKLFGLFAFSQVSEFHKKSPSKTRVDVVKEIRDNANNAYSDLKDEVTAAWGNAEKQLCTCIHQTADHVWSSKSDSFMSTLVYLNGLRNSLVTLEQKEIPQWSETYIDEYKDILDEFEQSTHTKRLGFLSKPDNVSNGTHSEEDEVKLLAQRSEGVEKQLHQSAEREEKRIPSGFALFGAGLLATLAIVPLLLTLLFGWAEKMLADLSILPLAPVWLKDSLTTLFITGTFVVLIMISSRLFRELYKRRAIDVQKDLLRFYFYDYAFQCAQHESSRRELVVKSVCGKFPLQGNIRSDIEKMRRGFQQQAFSPHDILIRSPAIKRDVFVGKDRWLQQNEEEAKKILQNSADHLLERLRNRAKELPQPDILREYLLAPFQDQRDQTAIVEEIGEKELQERLLKQIDAGVRKFIDQYPKEAFANFLSVLANSEVWEAEDTLLNKSLYLAHLDVMPTRFKYGSLKKPIGGLEATVTVYYQEKDTNNPEWVLDIALFSYNSPINVNVEALFPKIPQGVPEAEKTV